MQQEDTLMLLLDTEKVETVKEIIVNLARDIQQIRVGAKCQSIPIEHFLRKDGMIKSVCTHDNKRMCPVLLLYTIQKNLQSRKRYSLLFDGPEQKEE